MLYYKPHKGQKLLRRSKARFRVAVMGRRWGKTTFAVHELFEAALRKPGVYWWVGPDYEAVEKGWWILTSSVPEELIIKQRKSLPRYLTLENGSRIYFRSGNNPNSLRGEGLTGLVVDEAALIDKNAWDYVLRPSLADHEGWALFIGTPLGNQSWFNDLYLHGQSKDEEWSDWESFNAATSENPHVKRDELGRIKKQMSEETFRQEFLAQFLDDAGSVFRNIRRCIM